MGLTKEQKEVLKREKERKERKVHERQIVRKKSIHDGSTKI